MKQRKTKGFSECYAYWNGTPLIAPAFGEKEVIEWVCRKEQQAEENIKRNLAAGHTRESAIAILVDILNEMEALVCKHHSGESKLTTLAHIRLLCERCENDGWFEKNALKHTGGTPTVSNGFLFWSVWHGCVAEAMKLGARENDNNNGWLIVRSCL